MCELGGPTTDRYMKPRGYYYEAAYCERLGKIRVGHTMRLVNELKV